MMQYVSVIFTPEPNQWGLRGDPVLWQLLKGVTKSNITAIYLTSLPYLRRSKNFLGRFGVSDSLR